MKNLIHIFIVLILTSLTFSCDNEDFEDDLVKDSQPAVPVTYPGATTFGFNPYYTVSRSNDQEVTVQLSIPESSGRSIREISRVLVGGTAINAGQVADPKVAAFNAAPIPGDGTQATFSTSVANFLAKAGNVTEANITASSSGYVERAIMFQVTLDDGSVIIPVQCRIRFVK